MDFERKEKLFLKECEEELNERMASEEGESGECKSRSDFCSE